ncbi:hypothetical protein L207DRAFT_634774 [Hyaloscypha variabilis F]|uniref:Uncharacterized protein n=1 Tax=Hyaloscypha variabilis (strain UAMH 11265 / GT02V1 / F) TaxID=1149755 RepID=A0A2J6RJS6_HYAVF|nr:hypothetical protein L207DRAFT_634774 [Hyaloscypha variabilis F]
MQTPSILLALLLAASASASCLPVAAAVSSTAVTSTSVLASSATSVIATTANSTSFGTCSPAMDFQFGRAAFNRKATEGTFLPTDPVVAKGQQDALNPNIITNAICNNLINSCGVKQGDAGETACLAAKAMVASLGTKDASTAAAWNAALGV